MSWTIFNDPSTTYSSSFMPWNGVDMGGGTSGGEILIQLPTRPNTFITGLLSLFKQHARIDWADDDMLCRLYLGAAISRIEQFLEMKIAPASYEWDPSRALCARHRYLELIFRNATNDGNWVDFDRYRAKKIVPIPTTWPLKMEVGFDTVTDCPDDLVLSIFEMALGLYELRSNPEMSGMYGREIMTGNLSRYWVARV
jgi:hypothetical protein